MANLFAGTDVCKCSPRCVGNRRSLSSEASRQAPLLAPSNERRFTMMVESENNRALGGEERGMVNGEEEGERK